MKKILSLVLIAAMLASMLVFVPAAGAAEVPTVAVGSAAGVPGETVKIPVTITAGDVTAFSALVEYDGERLAYVGVDFAPVNTAAGATGYALATNGDPVYSNWYDNGNFVSFSWAAADKAAPDASEGIVVVNLTFTVKEKAPVGNAYVALRDHGVNGIYGTLVEDGAGVHQGAGNIACVDGGVVIVPADWTSFSDEADFVIEDGVLTEYLGEADFVVIPASVKTIASMAFMDATVTSVIIPATVETIETGAFLNCDLTDAYIYGADIELGEGCLGWAGSYSSRGGLELKEIVYVDEDSGIGILTIHSVPSANVDAYVAVKDKYGFYIPADETDAMYAMTFAGNTYLVPANTKAPGQMTIDGEVVAAWKNGDAYVAPGAALTLTADTALEAVTIAAPVSNAAAAIKANADVQKAALRFTATMDVEAYAALAAIGDVKLGMLITPAAYVAKAGAFTKTALDALNAKNGAYVDIELGGYFAKTETEYTFAAILTNFSATTYAKNPNFVSVMYATVTIGGVETTVYSAYDWAGVHNVKALATDALAVEATDTVKAELNALIAKFN